MTEDELALKALQFYFSGTLRENELATIAQAAKVPQVLGGAL